MQFEEKIQECLKEQKTWLVTGAAGFIGSNIVEILLKHNQKVVGLDNFSTGHKKNLQEIKNNISTEQYTLFQFVEGDVQDLNICQVACKNIDYVLHQAAVASVPASMENPLHAHDVNVTGFINMLIAARDNQVKRFVYASSSAVYGDGKELPKVEEKISDPISPYAANKYINEVYAKTFGQCYGLETVGLRYFNVYGPRQDPNGAYAAVMSKWLDALFSEQSAVIYGDGENTRDFVYVKDIVQANILSATVSHQPAVNQAYNIGTEESISLNQLFTMLSKLFSEKYPDFKMRKLQHEPARAGDIKHSVADISNARKHINYEPSYQLLEGLSDSFEWFCQDIMAVYSDS